MPESLGKLVGSTCLYWGSIPADWVSQITLFGERPYLSISFSGWYLLMHSPSTPWSMRSLKAARLFTGFSSSIT